MLRFVRILSNGTTGIPQEEGPRGRRSAVLPVRACEPEVTPSDPIRRGSGLVSVVVADGSPEEGAWA